MTQPLDLNLLRYLLIIDKYKTASTIINHLGISRSTLNRGLAQLRSHFDNELFILSNGQYHSTALAKDLMSRVFPLLSGIEDCLCKTSDSPLGKLKGTLSIFAPTYLSEPVTVGLMAGLQEQDCQLELKSHVWPIDNMPNLDSGDFAIGINSFPFDCSGNIIQRRLGSVTIGVYLRPDNPLAKFDSIDIGQLEKVQVALLDPGANVQNQENTVIERHGVTLKSAITVPSMHAALSCAERFNYLVFASNAYPEYRRRGLTWRPVTNDGHPIEYEYGFIYHRTWYQHPAMNSLEKILRSSFQQVISLNESSTTGSKGSELIKFD
ncbi:Transcriptional regulator-like protein [Shewanella sediminis HAW-EB3]|uniref:Transcriptional regulator-like protein n=1 Tax=Shewanella sediminis (strain HAW-EB3) TaxID=425104 RepID=A8FWF5_SHESH|nr:LysR family transcriptional regulator [Shewanella sediminis]ABV37178.1 Transcriptional regulator-like protein [Shewanella sediminis HAW-EB3]